MRNMAVRDGLDHLRTRFPGCSVVAFADLSTGMVFVASTRDKIAQERLDALCISAGDHLCGAVASSLAGGVFAAQDGPMQALSFDNCSVMGFVRSPIAPQEALCFICDPATPMAGLMGQGADLLSTFGEEA